MIPQILLPEDLLNPCMHAPLWAILCTKMSDQYRKLWQKSAGIPMMQPENEYKTPLSY
jgi:hypothetical protein